MAVSINGITCQEIVNQYTEAAEWTRGPSAVKGYLCPWPNRFTVANGLLGLSSTTTVGGTITLNLPMQHPEIPSIYVREIWFEGKGPFYQGTRNIAFPEAIIYARFGCIPWSFQGINYGNIDPSTPLIYAKQNLRIAAETKTIPAQKAWWQTLNVATTQEYGFPVAVVELEVEFMHVPYLPAQQVITSVSNPLNQSTFLGCAPGTVFFLGMENIQTFDTSGFFDNNCRFTFKYRPIAPWDQDWDGTQWDVVLDSSGGNPFIGRSDLNLLFPGAYAG